MKILSVIICIFLIFPKSYCAAPDSSQQAFINKIFQSVLAKNKTVLRERLRLENDDAIYRTGQVLSRQEMVWLVNLAEQYKLDSFALDAAQDWELLLTRVDSVPASVAIAQAITESAWGTSRFAVEANNYFGAWCYSEGCGVVPLQRPKGASYEVKQFDSLNASVSAYIANINTNAAYKSFRQLRFSIRQNDGLPSGLELVKTLNHYAQIGSAYVVILKKVMRDYGLASYDYKADGGAS